MMRTKSYPVLAFRLRLASTPDRFGVQTYRSAMRHLTPALCPASQADRLYLYEFFAPHGAVLSVRVLTDDAGACRGVGFVNYADNTSALAAIQACPEPSS